MESISRVSNFLEAARELTLEASRDASSARKPLRPLPPAQIQKLLDSRSERDVLDGLRRVIAMQYTSSLTTTLPFFPAVLKTLSHPTSATRPLVYAYLLHHAEADPDTALLAINTIQKSLSDTNPRVRAMALKTMSGIRVPVISQIVSLAIKKGVADMSPVVRKTAAFACVKCVRLDPSTLPQITDYIGQLIGDPQYYVAGAAVAAFFEVCPERLDLIHKHYRGLVRKMVDMDEWGQIATLKLLTIYSRKCFPYRTRRIRKNEKSQAERAKSFYDDEPAAAEDEAHDGDFVEEQALDPDLELFLNGCSPLLQSRTSAVILSVVHAFFALAPEKYLPQAIGPLVALLRSPVDTRLISLYNTVQVALCYPTLFVPYYRHFILHHLDSPQVFRLKLEILTLIFPYCTSEEQSLTMAELEHFSRSHDPSIVREAVRAIGRCAQSSTIATSRCLKLLLRQIHAQDQTLVAEALEVIRHLIQQDPQRHKRTIIRLAKNLDTLRGDKARASVIWLVGEFAGLTSLEQSVAPDVLRILIRSYADEGDEVRAQIVLLAAKVYLLWLNEQNKAHKDSGPPKQVEAPLQPLEGDENGFRNDPPPQTEVGEEKQHIIELLWQHTLLLARYTPDYDLRDRARLFRALLSVPASTELASLLLLAPKPVPLAPSPGETRRGLELGSATLVVGDEAGVAGLKGYEALPEWVKEGEEPDPRLREADDRRDTGLEKKVAAGRMLDEAVKIDRVFDTAPGREKEKTLEGWLAESEEEESSEEESGSEETESEESEEESSEEEDEETDDEDERRGLVR
ncbi:ARM repeat-containing protein [Myriangium duriaei CBS 260.36]|uniref:ARM repeat-containing protein n=1 Tax=Myriangium duriaei CBS 260.36 TaxID=1168546 RepID=A0A9P4J521_9PEZI|nr:ARM repeat-containing protein [Myriangium duriaei CBS 260.36]